MPRYRLYVDVKHTYQITLEADSEDHALGQANALQTTELDQYGAVTYIESTADADSLELLDEED